MKKNILTLAALQAIATANADGFTVNKTTGAAITAGFAVAVADTQNSFGADGAASVLDYVANNDGVQAVGGWYNNENGKYYYDAVIICDDLETAKRLGRENKQIAVFDLDNLEEIKL